MNDLTKCEDYAKAFDGFLGFLNIRCSAFQNSKISEKCLAFIIPFVPKVARSKELSRWETHKIEIVRHLQTQDKQMHDFVSKNMKRLN